MQFVLYYTSDAINLILVLPTNVYVLWLIVTGPGETVNSDFFALDLAVTEIFSGLSGLAFIINNYRRAAALVNLAQYFKGFVLYGRPLFQGFVCVERYLAVIHPVTFLKYKPLRYRMGCSGVAWLLIIGTCVGYMLVETSLEWRCYALVFNLVLLSVMLFCCLAVLKALKRPGPGDREGEGTNNMKLRAFRIILTIMVFSVVMYLPRVLLLFSFHFIDPISWEEMANCVYSNSNLSAIEENHMYAQYLAYTSADVINLILGLPANVYVLWLIVTGPGETMNSDFFALNLAVTEIVSSLSSLAFIIYNQQHADTLLPFAIFFAAFTLYGRPLFHGCICVERYLAVIHPVTFLKYKPLRYRMGCSGVVWVLVIGSCFGYMLAETTLEWRGYALSFNIVLFSVMLFCCLAVLRALKRPGPGDKEGDREGTNNTKLKAFRIISAIMVSMVIMYFPMSMKIPIFFTADAINVLMSLPANVYVLWLIVTGPNGAINSDFFALNLAASEILSSISSLMFIIYKLYQQADLFLSFARFLSGVVLFGRPLFHGCICVERYLAVIHPVTFLKYKPLRYRVGCSGVVWVLVIGSCFGYMLAETTLEWRGYALSFNIVLFSVMLFCCLAVLRALKLPGPGDREGDREWTNNTKLKAFRIISAIMVSMVIIPFSTSTEQENCLVLKGPEETFLCL
ncbi:hypothetical protein DPEC_G00181160 [Dallia pectoralis]|uniref:Uncharacterized protein n=1 Tax=Dallia pectoralis TaxID=75939 RepID=A0ACC2GA26_DALPE|nr:hypothetical protein DPEC_G00181160 [Dallia pectoralis]